MTIELHINGEFTRAWILEDIREGYSEKGIQKWERQIRLEVNEIKNGLYELLEYNEWEFFVVYESRAHLMQVTYRDMVIFDKQIKLKRVGRFINKYNRAS